MGTKLSTEPQQLFPGYKTSAAVQEPLVSRQLNYNVKVTKKKKKKGVVEQACAQLPNGPQSSNCSRRKRRHRSHVRRVPHDTPLNLLQAAKQSRRTEQKEMSEHIRRVWRSVRHGLLQSLRDSKR